MGESFVIVVSVIFIVIGVIGFLVGVGCGEPVPAVLGAIVFICGFTLIASGSIIQEDIYTDLTDQGFQVSDIDSGINEVSIIIEGETYRCDVVKDTVWHLRSKENCKKISPEVILTPDDIKGE